MMRISTIILSAVILVAPAYGADQIIRVSAGEHKDYSRIVISSNTNKIEVEQSGRLVHIKHIDASALLDLREVNDQRKAFRILNAKQLRIAGGSMIELTINCDCEVRSSRLTNQKFVIDIVDPGKLDKQPRTSENKKNSAQEAATTENLLTLDDRISVEQAHSRMVALLKKAADEGLITITDDGAASQDISAPTQLLDQGTLSIKPVPEQETAKTAPSPPKKEVATAALQSPKFRCLPDAALRIDGEAFDAEPLVEIANYQVQLAEASGDEEVQLLHQLAAGFISVGFGEEALSLLKDYGEDKSYRADIARAIAERPIASDSQLMNAQNCQGDHALWQAAATAPTQAVDAYRRSNGAIKHLPARLKTLIATRLAMKMTTAQAWLESQELFDIASAGQETLGPELEYVQARLTEVNGDAETARTALLEIAAENSNASGDALLALADSYAQKRREPHEGFKEDIGALAKLAGSSKAAFSEAIAWAQIGNTEAALMLLGNEASKSSTLVEQARTTAIPILKKAIINQDRPSRISALDAYLDHRDWLRIGVSEVELRSEIADAAFDFGLPNLALDILKHGPKHPNKEYILATASAALAAGEANEAIVISAPYTTDLAFGKILVKANIERSEYHTALASAAALNDDSARAAMTARAGWLAKAWQNAAVGFKSMDPNSIDGNAAIQFALSAYMSGETTLPAAADAVLSKNSSVIRDGLQSLFSTGDTGTALEKSRQIVGGVTQEILAYQELLENG
jgi:hypothetical protein